MSEDIFRKRAEVIYEKIFKPRYPEDNQMTDDLELTEADIAQATLELNRAGIKEIEAEDIKYFRNKLANLIARGADPEATLKVRKQLEMAIEIHQLND